MITAVLFKMIQLLETEGVQDVFDSVLHHLRRPTEAIIPLLLILLILPTLHIPAEFLSLFRHALSVLFIMSTAWFSVNAVRVARDLVLFKYDIKQKDNLRAREMLTRIKLIERIVFVVILIVAAAMALMTFDKVKQLGIGILASAGIIGIVAGFSAQKTLSTVFAGLQIAVTQPIRMDDVVVVENEWGRIEEITLTYVVIKLWDLRRLILPVTYFIEKPFQNWTRISADILGTVFLYTDYTVPVQDIRQEFKRILKHTDLWDGKAANIQVTDATASAIEVRALMSAEDASKAWDLRCLVREELIAFLQARYPECLPKSRVELNPLSESARNPLGGFSRDPIR